MIVAFIDELRAEGHDVESICRVLREQGCQIAARTYRDWARVNRPVAARTSSDALVVDQVRDLAWKVDHAGVRRMTEAAGEYRELYYDADNGVWKSQED